MYISEFVLLHHLFGCTWCRRSAKNSEFIQKESLFDTTYFRSPLVTIVSCIILLLLSRLYVIPVKLAVYRCIRSRIRGTLDQIRSYNEQAGLCTGSFRKLIIKRSNKKRELKCNNGRIRYQRRPLFDQIGA